MISAIKPLTASILLGLALSSGFAQLNVAQQIAAGEQALLVGWDFDNILSGNLPASPVHGRYSDVFGNWIHTPFLTAAGGIYLNGYFGSDNWGTVAKSSFGDINRNILTRAGSGSIFDLGGLTGNEGAVNFNNVNVGVSFDEFSINLHTRDAVNSFERLSLSLWGRDVSNTAGGAVINWFYSIDDGITKMPTGLASSFVGNVFSESVVNFSPITALNGLADIYLIGQTVESQSSVVLNIDNIAAYAYAIPEPAASAVVMSGLTLVATAVRLRRLRQAQS